MPVLTKVPLTEAIPNIARYRSQITNWGVDAPFAFMIKHEDLIEVLGITKSGVMEYERFRIYFGLTDETPMKWRSYLVPVVPTEHPAGEDHIPFDPGFGEYVYDFDAPCPTTCDFGSKLYTLSL